MRKPISTSFVFGMLTLSATAPALAFTTTYLDTGYAATSFTTLSFDARAFAFDNSMNLFASSTADDNTGTINISKFFAASNYTTSSTAYSYTASGGVTGLDFHGSQLIAAVSSADGNRGGIYDAATAALIKKLPDFRPTGIDARADILFTGRLASNLDFGNVYKLNADNSLSIIISNLPLRGIATDSSANIFVSTTPDQYGSFLGNSIYEFSSVDDYNPSTAKLIATLGGTGSTELTFDNQGRLYSLYSLGGSTEIIQITAVPEPETYAMLMAGLGLVSFMVRRRKTA